jgi:hypothetical protein
VVDSTLLAIEDFRDRLGTSTPTMVHSWNPSKSGWRQTQISFAASLDWKRLSDEISDEALKARSDEFEIGGYAGAADGEGLKQ